MPPCSRWRRRWASIASCSPLLPVMQDLYGVTASEAGIITSANFAGYLAGALARPQHAFPEIVRPGSSARSSWADRRRERWAWGRASLFSSSYGISAGMAGAFAIVVATAIMVEPSQRMVEARCSPCTSLVVASAKAGWV
ncbi:YbfB/YjiJ family MFS transporter [Bradyrhizobium sp. CCBAU 11430]|uniref:YbfB/YjiJ family MFS transporter n=1 Tax=Bradyrhizobium sp. CCBAU 11430 TaxID=1630881 RepID=UPI003FA4BCD9